jgi:predicted Zn finger-like uncharacterized protein
MIYDPVMKLSCPNCGAIYEVPENAIGATGRKIRCRACDTSWFEPGRAAPAVAAESPPPVASPAAPMPIAPVTPPTTLAPPVAKPRGRRGRGPWLLLALVVLVVILGGIAATVMMGTQQVASRLGIAEDRVPLGIAITREPDWRMIAGGSQLFAVSGRVWNPTNVEQSVPDIRAELRNAQGKTIYAWTITRPAARLAPGAAVNFDGAAVDVPANSTNVSVSFVGTGVDHQK